MSEPITIINIEYLPELATFELKLSNGNIVRMTDVVFNEIRQKMPIKTDKENFQELKNKIQELRRKKLLTIEGVEKHGQELESEIEQVNQDLRDGKIDTKVAMALIKGIDSKRGILRECRLALGFLTKEEGRIEFELLKLSK